MLSIQLRIAFAVCLVCFVSVVTALMIGHAIMPRDQLTFTSWNGMGYEIYVLDMQRRLVMALPAGYSPYQNYYGWSDVGRFAFLSDRDGNTEVYLWDWQTMTNISQHGFHDWRPTMARDGRVAWASERDGNMEIYVWDEGTLTNVSQNTRTDDYPVWSNDGRLAWLSDRDGEAEIYVWDGVSIVNVSQSPLTTEHSPRWGDGPLMWIADGPAELLGGYMWDGTQVARLPILSVNFGMTWSNDGRLAYREGADIYVWDGTQSINVSQSQFADEYSPAWGADGRLVFISMRNTPSEIYLWDGATLQELTYNEMSEEGVIWSR